MSLGLAERQGDLLDDVDRFVTGRCRRHPCTRCCTGSETSCSPTRCFADLFAGITPTDP